MGHRLRSYLANLPALGRIAVFTLLLLVAWLPFAIPIYATVPDPNWVSIVSMAILYIGFVVIVRWWGRWVHHEPQPLQRYGVVWSRTNAIELLRNTALGWLLVAFVFSLETAIGLVAWQAPPLNLGMVVIEGAAIGLGVAAAEELVFRGWLWDELHRDYPREVVLVLNAVIFAVLHYIRPLDVILTTLPQFVGLFLLGLVLGWTKRIGRDRLGGAIGLHGGLVWSYYVVNVGKLVDYTGVAPEWVTGIAGNPLAGAIGLGVLAGLGVVLARRISW